MFKATHPELRLGQTSFEKCKPCYVRKNTISNTYCCRYHIEFYYYYTTFLHIHWFLHPNHVQEFSSTTTPISLRDLIHTIMYLMKDGQRYYAKKYYMVLVTYVVGYDYGVRESMRVKIIHLRR